MFSILAVCMLAASPGFSQKYKTIADTAALNREYAKVTAEINDLTSKLDKAKSEQAENYRKSGNATSDAQSTASSASTKAENSINGSVKQAKKAKRAAKRSVKDAKDARHAQGNLDDSNKKVSKLTAELEQKQKRLKQLDEMRAAINSMQQ
jgi:chromosome segregation ATPase